MYAYSEPTFGGPTIGYVMTENWVYACCCFWQYFSERHLGHTDNIGLQFPEIHFDKPC